MVGWDGWDGWIPEKVRRVQKEVLKLCAKLGFFFHSGVFWTWRFFNMFFFFKVDFPNCIGHQHVLLEQEKVRNPISFTAFTQIFCRTTGCFSLLTFSWVGSLISMGYQREKQRLQGGDFMLRVMSFIDLLVFLPEWMKQSRFRFGILARRVGTYIVTPKLKRNSVKKTPFFFGGCIFSF